MVTIAAIIPFATSTAKQHNIDDYVALLKHQILLLVDVKSYINNSSGQSVCTLSGFIVFLVTAKSVQIIKMIILQSHIQIICGLRSKR